MQGVCTLLIIVLTISGSKPLPLDDDECSQTAYKQIGGYVVSIMFHWRHQLQHSIMHGLTFIFYMCNITS